MLFLFEPIKIRKILLFKFKLNTIFSHANGFGVVICPKDNKSFLVFTKLEQNKQQNERNSKKTRNRLKIDVAVIPELEFDFQRRNIPISRELSFESLLEPLFEWYTSKDLTSNVLKVVFEDAD